MKTITSFKAKLFQVGKTSQAVVVPKSKFDENILVKGKRYEFFVSEVTE